MAKKKRASAWTTHVRNVMRTCKSLGIPHDRAMKLASRTYNKSSGKPKADWKTLVRKYGKGGGGSSRKSSKGRRRGHRGGSNLDSFSGLDNFLTRLLGGVKKVLSPRLRPSESLAQRKARLEGLISKMNAGISALKDREKIEDMSRAQYKSHVDEIRRLQKAISDLKRAWKEAHRKQGRRSASGGSGGFPKGWNEHEPYSDGHGMPRDWNQVDGDPPGRKKKSKKPKKKSKKSGSHRVSAATKKKMRAAAKRRWARIRAYRKRGYSLAKARAAARRDAKGGKSKSKGKKSKKKSSSRRDWSGDFGSFE